jgi:hypothetical protein
MIDDETASGVTVEQVSLPTWAGSVLVEAGGRADLVVLPRAVRDGRGEYRAVDLPVVKALRAAGVNADWAHEAAERTFASEYGAREDALVISLFVAQALGEESVVQVARWLLGRMRQLLARRLSHEGSPSVVVEVARLVVHGDRREIEGLRVTGTGEQGVAAVADAVASLLRGDPPPK